VPKEHRFRYGLYMVYLDLDELPMLLKDRVLRAARFAPLSFRRADHLNGGQTSLVDAVRNLVDERTGHRPAGPIRLLTGLRCFGYYFSPLNLFYCFDPNGKTVETVVAEVSNTPWRETHYYMLSDANRVGTSGQLHFSHPKGFHVSPFMEMDLHYEWHLSQPGSRLAVEITNRQGTETVFQAGLTLSQRSLGRWTLFRMLFRYPWMTGRVALAIYYQAFRLWRKKCPFYPHPRHRSRPAGVQ
jgi:DUF1365 family protein